MSGSDITASNSALMGEFYGSNHLSEAIKANGFLFVSGSVGFNPDSTMPDDFREQCANAFRHIRKVIEEGGGDPARIVQMLIISTDVGNDVLMDDFAILLEEKKSIIPESKPVCTGLRAVALALPSIKAEIQVVVAL